jgi:hypothetical protein
MLILSKKGDRINMIYRIFLGMRVALDKRGGENEDRSDAHLGVASVSASRPSSFLLPPSSL